MKKLSSIFGLLLVFAMVLAACAPQDGDGEDLIGTPSPMETQTGMDTPEVIDTPEIQATGTQPATAEATAQATPATSPTVTADPGTLPGTGSLIPALVSNLMEFNVCGITPNDAQDVWGEVADFIVDYRSEYRLSQEGPNFTTGSDTALARSNGRITYVLLEAGDDFDLQGNVLIPWKAVSFRGAMGAEPAAGSCLLVNLERSLVQTAPTIDLDTVDVASTGWDAEIRTFWEAELGDLNTVGEGDTTISTPEATSAVGTPLSGTPASGTPASGTPASGTPSSGTPVVSPTPGTGSTMTTPTAGTPGAGTPAATQGAGTPAATQVGGSTGSSQAAIQLGVFRASELLGMTLDGSGGETLGTVNDLVVDIQTGAVLYAVAEVGGAAGMGGREIFIPVWLLMQRIGGESLYLPTTSASLENAPAFNQADLVGAVNLGWDEELFRWWNDVFRP